MFDRYRMLKYFVVAIAMLISSVSQARVAVKVQLRPEPKVVPNFKAFPKYDKDKLQRAGLAKDFLSRYVDEYIAGYMTANNLKENPFPPDLKESIGQAVERDIFAQVTLRPLDLKFWVRTIKLGMDSLAERIDHAMAAAATQEKLDAINARLARIESGTASLQGATAPVGESSMLQSLPPWLGARRLTMILGVACVLMVVLLIKLFMR